MKQIVYLLHGAILAGGAAVVYYLGGVSTIQQVSPLTIFPAILVSIAVESGVALLIFALLRKPAYAGLIVTLLVLGLAYQWPVFIFISAATVAGLFIFWMVRRKISWDDLHLVLNLVSVLVVGFFVIQFIDFVRREPWEEFRSMVAPAGIQPARSQQNKPDIYYIVLDGYGGADMLQSVHGFDNSHFIADLEQRGFRVASRSQANYPRTFLSLSSSLNMQYLDKMSGIMGNSGEVWASIDSIHHSQVRSLLESKGYKTVFLANNWDYTSISDGDLYKKPYPVMLNDFEKSYLEYTNLDLFKWIRYLGVSYPSFEVQRRTILYAFDTLPALSSIPGPKFVFVHILAPHPPFVFDQYGNPLNPSYKMTLFDAPRFVGDASQYERGYLQQLIFINRETLAMIDGVLLKSETPPVIIIQGDHGPGVYFDKGQNTCWYERYSILNAYLLPGLDPDSLPQDINPVNSFRFVFNTYLGTDFGLLPHKQYYSAGDSLYQFRDITGLTQTCKLPETDAP
jgi:hypothetical protein